MLDPVRVDCCGHGLFALLPELRAKERGVTYIPVRLEETTLYRPHVAPARAVIEVVSKSERSIVTNCYIYGAKDEIIAVLRGVRGQAISTRRTSSLDAVAYVELPRLIDGTISGQTGVGGTAADVIKAAGTLGLAQDGSAASSEAEVLTEAWATAAAYEIASGSCGRGKSMSRVDRRRTFAGEHCGPGWSTFWSISKRPTWQKGKKRSGRLMIRHARLDLGRESAGDGAAVACGRTVACCGLVRLCQAGDGKQGRERDGASIISKTALEFYNSTSIALRESSATLYRLLLENKRLWPKSRALRVLQVGFAPLAQLLLASEHSDALLLTVYEPDRRRFESADLALSKNKDVRLVDADQISELGRYDLIVSAGGLHRLPPDLGLTELNELLSPGGLLVAIEPRTSLFKDLVFGLDPGWFSKGTPDRPLSPLRPVAHWPERLNEAGFRNPAATLISCGSGLACLVAAEAPQPGIE